MEFLRRVRRREGGREGGREGERWREERGREREREGGREGEGERRKSSEIDAKAAKSTHTHTLAQTIASNYKRYKQS